MAGKAAKGNGRAERERTRYNGPTWGSDMAGKAAKGNGRAERERTRYNGATRAREMEESCQGRRSLARTARWGNSGADFKGRPKLFKRLLQRPRTSEEGLLV